MVVQRSHEMFRVTVWCLTLFMVLGSGSAATAAGSPAPSADVFANGIAAHVDVIPSGNVKIVHGLIAAPEGLAEFTFNGKSLVFGDGYRVDHEILTNNAAELVVRITGTTPDGISGTALLRYNRQTGMSSTTGLEGLAALMSGSHDLPITSRALRTMRQGSGPSPFSVLGDCTDFSLLFIGAETAAYAACGTGDPISCAMMLGACAAALDQMMSACFYELPDGTIGWG